jgi:hypothetical protein
MDNKIIGKVKLPPVEQIGIVVKDMDQAIDYYSSRYVFFQSLAWEIRD